MVEDQQINVFIDRVRVPEIIYQPSIIGYDQAGLGEVIHRILRHMDAKDAASVVQNMFGTGGNTRLPYFTERLLYEVQQIRPFQSVLHATRARDPILDAWHGGRLFATQSDAFKQSCITRSDYEEKGSEYLKEHSFSNVFYPTPDVDPNNVSTDRRRKKRRV